MIQVKLWCVAEYVHVLGTNWHTDIACEVFKFGPLQLMGEDIKVVGKGAK